MQQVLCFGDSNTWGYDPANRGERYSPQLRWTGLLQMLLAQSSGHQWKVVEEGSTAEPRYLAQSWSLIGLAQLYRPLCAQPQTAVRNHSYAGNQRYQNPLSCHRTNHCAGNGTVAAGNTLACASESRVPPILLIAPKPLNPDIMNPEFDRQSAEKSSQLAAFYRQIAAKYGCDFLDAGAFMPFPSLDGIHLSAQEHRILAQAVADWVCKLPPRT